MADTGYVTDIIFGEGALGGAARDVSGGAGGNVCLGYQVLFSMTTASNNMAMGHETLYSATSGSGNVAIGAFSARNLTTGGTNVGVGTQAMRLITEGDDNTALGNLALYSITVGDYNVALGSNAGFNIVTGIGNIIIGYGVNASGPDVDYELNIGDIIKGSTASGGEYVSFPFGVVNKTTRITGATTLDATHNVVFADTDGSAYTVTLPAGVEGTHYKIINCGSSANDLTVDPDGTEQVYGGGAGVAQTLADGEVIDIHYNATEGWW